MPEAPYCGEHQGVMVARDEMGREWYCPGCERAKSAAVRASGEPQKELLKSIRSGLQAIYDFTGDSSGRHASGCNGGDDGPCDCGFVEPRGVAEALLEQLAAAEGLPRGEDPLVAAVTRIVREADRAFQKIGGGSRHWVRDCFLPTLNASGFQVVPAAASPSDDGARQPQEDYTRQFFRRLRSFDWLTAPEAILEEDGDIGCDWVVNGGTVSAHVSANGRAGWAALVGEHKSSGSFQLPDWSEMFTEALRQLAAASDDGAARPQPEIGSKTNAARRDICENTDAHRQAANQWFKANGYVPSGLGMWGIAFDTRSGYDFTDLEFYPLQRRSNDGGWDAIVGCHASGENPRIIIGTCENLVDVQRTHETIRLINGYKPQSVVDQPQSQCPKCHRWQDDLDGFGVLKCQTCDFCAHPSIDGDTCNICGRQPAALSSPSVAQGWTGQDLLRLFMCERCVDEHGSNPQSVSCYCDCHSSTRDESRWPSVRERVIAALASLPVADSPTYIRMYAEAAAWREIARRSDDAHTYCYAHGLRLGLNIWHAILDDAIRLRASPPSTPAGADGPNEER